MQRNPNTKSDHLLKPWVHKVEDPKNFSVFYDVLTSKSPSVQLSGQAPQEMILKCDQKIYIERLKTGSDLDQYIPWDPLPPLNRLDIVLGGKCAYHDICPLPKKEIIPSFTCEMCYLGKDCGLMNSASKSQLEHLFTIVSEMDPINVSLSGEDAFSEEIIALIAKVFAKHDLLNKPNIHKHTIMLNVPYYKLLEANDSFLKIMNNLRQRLPNNAQIMPSFSLFYDDSSGNIAAFTEKLHLLNKAGPCCVTLVFNLHDWTKVQSMIGELKIGASHVILAPYLIPTEVTSIDTPGISKISHKDLNVYGLTLTIYRGYIPCMFSCALLDSDLNVSNCKALWINNKQKLNRKNLKDIWINWKWKKEQICLQCSFRGGCVSCMKFTEKLIEKAGHCPIKSDKLGGP